MLASHGAAVNALGGFLRSMAAGGAPAVAQLLQNGQGNGARALASHAGPGLPPWVDDKAGRVQQLLAAKEKSGKSFSQIAKEVGLTNVYTAQLFHGQQQLQPNTVAALRKAVPSLGDDDVAAMQRAPQRSFHPDVLQEPSLYRVYEALCHGGDSIKALINEHWGDGIMSAIGFYATVDKAVGLEGEPRVIITFNGKFLPYVEQRVADNIAQRKDE